MSWPWVLAVIGLWLSVVFLAVVVLGLLRKVSSFMEAAESRLGGASVPPGFGGLEPGSVVPPFTVLDGDGQVVLSSDLLGSSVLLLFMEAGCEPCDDLALALRGVGQTIGSVAFWILTDADSPEPMRLPEGTRVLFQTQKSASKAFQNIASPQLFAVRHHMVIGKKIPETIEDVTRLASLVGEGGDAARPVEPGRVPAM